MPNRLAFLVIPVGPAMPAPHVSETTLAVHLPRRISGNLALGPYCPRLELAYNLTTRRPLYWNLHEVRGPH